MAVASSCTSTFEPMPKGENFGLQGCARPEQPGYGVPDQLEEIAHQHDLALGKLGVGPSCLWASPAATPCNFPCNSARNKTENRAARYLQGRFFGQPSGTDVNKFLTLFQILAIEKPQNWPDRATAFESEGREFESLRARQ
jgi:hypothetical protein